MNFGLRVQVLNYIFRILLLRLEYHFLKILALKQRCSSIFDSKFIVILKISVISLICRHITNLKIQKKSFVTRKNSRLKQLWPKYRTEPKTRATNAFWTANYSSWNYYSTEEAYLELLEVFIKILQFFDFPFSKKLVLF